MVIAIGANGDGVLHWRHYVHHHWSQWIAIGTIICRHWRQKMVPWIMNHRAIRVFKRFFTGMNLLM
jgi:hypothetical protein